MDRRLFLTAAAAALGLAATPARADNTPRPTGHLMAIGGAEDRRGDMQVLQHFIDLCGTPEPMVAVITAASGVPAESWQTYERAFGELGAARCVHLDLRTPEDAQDLMAMDTLLEADGIFMTGGDQRRLMAVLQDSAVHRALHLAFHVNGACIAGTSAGAAALSQQMLAEGRATPLPEKDAARIDQGLGLLPAAIIDQHFSQRHRLGRLLSAVAEQPGLLGVGIDEDTALVVRPGQGVEVVGAGSVTVVDGRRMWSNVEAAQAADPLELMGVRLHVLPAGNRYELGAQLADPLREAIGALVRPESTLG
jgi:cyanophycinase